MAQQNVTDLTAERKARNAAKGGIPTGTPPIATGFLSAWRAGAWQAQGNPPATPPAAPVQGAASTAPTNNTPEYGGGNGGGGTPPENPQAASYLAVSKSLAMAGWFTLVVAIMYGLLSWRSSELQHKERMAQVDVALAGKTVIPGFPESAIIMAATGKTTAVQPVITSASPQSASGNSLPDCLIVGKIGAGESCTLKEIRTDVNVDYPTSWSGSSSCVEQKSFEVTDDATQSVVRPMMNDHGNQSLRSCGQYSYFVSRGTLYFVKR